MSTVSQTCLFPASGLVPVLPLKPRPIDDDRLAVEIEILRRRQLRRDDVRELLLRRAEREGGGAMTRTLTVSLAEQINSEHAACLKAANDALEHAMRCGDLLIQAKANTQHGQWQDWLKGNFAGSVRSAQVYMRLANNRDQLAKAQSPALLTIYEAAQLLSESSFNLPPDVEAKLAPLAVEIRGLLEELTDNEREERKHWQEIKALLGERIYDFAAAEMGMSKSEVTEKLRGGNHD